MSYLRKREVRKRDRRRKNEKIDAILARARPSRPILLPLPPAPSRLPIGIRREDLGLDLQCSHTDSGCRTGETRAWSFGAEGGDKGFDVEIVLVGEM